MKKSEIIGTAKNPLTFTLNQTRLLGTAVITTSREWPRMRGYRVGDSFFIKDAATFTVFQGSVVEINEDTGVVRIEIPAQ